MQKVKISFFDRIRAFLGDQTSIYYINHAQDIVDMRIDRISWRDITKSTHLTLSMARKIFYQAIGLSYDIRRTYITQNHECLKDLPAAIRSRLVAAGLLSYIDIYQFVRDQNIPLDNDYGKRLSYIDGIGAHYADTILNWMLNGMAFRINEEGHGRFVDMADIDPEIQDDNQENPEIEKETA